jgi:hypothetical protein
MTWKKKPPKRPGWYWWKDDIEGIDPCIIEVESYQLGLGACRGGTLTTDRIQDVGGVWGSRIPDYK